MYCIIVKVRIKPGTRERLLAAHKDTTHYRASRAVVSEVVAQQSVIRCDVLAVNPAR